MTCGFVGPFGSSGPLLFELVVFTVFGGVEDEPKSRYPTANTAITPSTIATINLFRSAGLLSAKIGI